MQGLVYVIEKLGVTMGELERQLAAQAAEIERLKAELAKRPPVPPAE